MSIPNNYTTTGPANSFRVIKKGNGDWEVQGTDNNNVWVSADPGATYETQEAAEEAAEAWAENRGGELVVVID